MTMIHPICRRLPSSMAIWDDTNLPLSCVVTPLTTTTSTTDDETTSSSSSSSNPIEPLASIPKCLHCGAPHPSAVSHYPLLSSLLCHLCGKTSSSRWEDQRLKRQGEYMAEETYTYTNHKTKPSSTSGQVMEYALPISISSSSSSSYGLQQQQQQVSYAVPAMSCPPLWWIVMEGCPSRVYWNVISQALSAVVSQLPPFIHVGLIMASSSHVSCWDVTSAVPFVKHSSWKAMTNTAASTNTTSNEFIVADVGTYQSHIQAALRAMGDSMIVTDGNLPLTKLLTVLLDQITSCGGQHPGQSTTSTIAAGATRHESSLVRPYAGGRVLVILNGAPSELQGATNDDTSASGLHMGTNGGRGGACHQAGERFSNMSTNDTSVPALSEEDPETGQRTSYTSAKHVPATTASTTLDLTATSLEKQYPQMDGKTRMKEFQQLGQQFAEAALGLDILVVQDELQRNKNVGLALLKPLYESTGAPGPVLFDLSSHQQTESNSIIEELSDEIWSRGPTNFGGLLRVRMSPGFKVDSSPVEPTSRSPLQLSPLHSRKGLMGPAAATQEDSLWQMGSCDRYQAVTLDLLVTNKIKRFAFVDSLGEVALKPCIQVCFAYTTIIPSETQDDEYVTVRRMRICTLHMPIVNDVESLYASLNPDALSVVLMHQFALSVFAEGLAETQKMARKWLQFVMVCAYKSAEAVHKRQQELIARGMDPHSEATRMFYPSERLMDQGGSMTQEDILLGQGHDTLRLIPRIVWSLLQCDAFRLPSETYKPTLDARCSAMMQMMSMTPDVLTRCNIPRLELWASGEDVTEPIASDVGLSMEDIAVQLMEHQQTDSNLILFLDSPFLILVCDSRHLRAAPGNGVVVGEKLEQKIQQSVNRYRTIPPAIVYALDLTWPIAHLWKDVLIQDSVTSDSSRQDFEHWKNNVSTNIFNELSGELGDY